jgi:Flp pilus assembly protein CpaB
VKKKTPPYAIIGAVLLGIIAIVIFVQLKKQQAADEQAREDKLRSDMQAQIDAANAAKAPVVQESDTHTRPVLYATQPVEPGQRISPAFFEKKPTPTDILPDAYTDQNDITGFYAIRKIEKGDPLTPRNIGKTLPYLSQRITPGMRAVSLPIFDSAPVNNTGGFIVDGDKVDLLLTIDPQDPNDPSQKIEVNTQLVMQSVPVLYVPGPTVKTDKTDGITPVTPPGDAISVTFEVSPEQAEALIYLSQLKDAHFSMILRSRRDQSEIAIKPFDGRDYDFLNLKKVQKWVDKSDDRVNELTKEIEAKEKAMAPPPGTNQNETPPTPAPSP